MPDPRLVGLHEVRALIHQLNEANLRAATAHAHLSEAGVDDEGDVLLSVKQTIEQELLPRSVRLLKGLQGDTVEN